MTTWFSSDHHFGHANIIGLSQRPFATIDEMNEELVRRWNAVVDPLDTVYYLGDFSLSRAAVETYLKRLNGTKHLIAGNHDHCHPVHAKKDAKALRMKYWYMEQGFASVVLEDQIVLGLEPVSLHHMPYTEDHYGEARYLEWRPKNNGGWLLHGHVHTGWKMKEKQINVGVDVWNFTPVNLDQVLQIIKENS